MANIMSVDVEDWFHLLELSSTPAIGDEQAADSLTQDQHQRPSPMQVQDPESPGPSHQQENREYADKVSQRGAWAGAARVTKIGFDTRTTLWRDPRMR